MSENTFEYIFFKISASVEVLCYRDGPQKISCRWVVKSLVIIVYIWSCEWQCDRDDNITHSIRTVGAQLVQSFTMNY